MELQKYCPEWLETLRAQEQLLRVESMSAEEAFRLGTIMIRLAKEVYRKPAAFRIMLAGQTTFSYLMDGTNTLNEWWMNKKLNTVRVTGVSSILSLVEVGMGLRAMEPEFENDSDFALCGGCFPLRNAAGKLLGYVLCSGMPHRCDHQLIADALAEFLNVEIPRIDI